jgi:serine phosphatase RsbU (regulator of sigma subunit)
MKYKSFILVSFLLFSLVELAQNRTLDSLQLIISKKINDTTHVKAMLNFSAMIRNSDLTKSIKLSTEALDLSQKLKFKKGSGLANLNLGTTYHVQGIYDSAEVRYHNALEVFKELKLKKNISKCYNNLGNLYQLKADYSKAIEFLIMCKKIAEELKDDKAMSDCELNIGNVYIQKKDYSTALKQYYKSLALSQKINDLSNLAQCYNNIGATQRYLNQTDSTLINYKKALAIRYQVNDLGGIAESTLNIGDAYSNIKNYDSALVYFKKSYELYTNINSQAGVAYSLHNMGGVLFHLNQGKESLKILQQSVVLSSALGLRDLKLSAYKMIAEVLFKQASYKESAEYLMKIQALNDSLLNENSNKQIAEMQTMYESEKKDKEIVKQNAEIKNQIISADKKAAEAKVLIIGILLLLLVVVFIFRGYKQKQKANQMITLQKKEVEYKNQVIEEKQKEIVDSINYAKRIQYSLLAHSDFLAQYLPQYFVYFNPKDIVSGDFYWATKKDNKFYFAVCDSTGHGVPGAFMSLLNIGFLSEAINEKNIDSPNEVFNYARKRLCESVSRDGQKDGFDGILVCLDLISKKVTYSAANNKPVFIRKGEYMDLATDKMPVGAGERFEDFKLYSIDTAPGDILYLYTDGYADQFGGPKGKKFKYKPLNELILANHHLSMQEQKNNIQINFNAWRGDLEQVDDVLIACIKF